MDAVDPIDKKPPKLAKQGFVAGGAAAMPVAGGVVLRIRLRFHNHAPQQLAIRLALHQQAADEVGGNQLGGAGEEGLGEVLGGLGGYGSGFRDWVEAIGRDGQKAQRMLFQNSNLVNQKR